MDIKNMISSRKDIANMLKRTYLKNRLSHAYLFNGENGTGKKELAFYFACMHYCKEEDGPCLECYECKNILRNEHLNVTYIQKDGQGIKKEQIIALQEEFSMTSLVDGPRIYIIDGIEKISTQAANSLLKFIEEPINKETYGILLTEDINQVLPTIISRSSVINFPSFEKKQLTSILMQNNIESFIATILPYLTNNIDEAIEIAANEEIIKLPLLMKKYLDINNAKDAILFMNENGSILDDKNYLEKFLSLVVIIYEDALRILYEDDNIVYDQIKEDVVRFTSNRSIEKIRNDLKLVLEYNQRLQYNVSARNILHQLFVNLF